MKRINAKHNVGNRYHILSLLLTITITASILSACGDFRDEPIPQTPAPQPQPVPTPEPQPGPKPQPHGETEEQRNKRLCEAERRWALESRLIDLNQYHLYEHRNFAPVFNTTGERQSGVDGWVKCEKALEINGFIPPKDRDNRPPVVTTPTEAPKTPKSPAPSNPPNPETRPSSDDEEANRMCEEERDYVLKAGFIDPNLYRMFKRRNFAPVYQNPGERQSGIESWQPCLTCLRINGFIWY